MLISRRPDRLQLITHPDHGRVAGVLAEHWGGAAFAVPAPREALILAATHHDDGWAELDGRPAFNADAGRPAHFLELPLPETVGPYGRGVDTVYDRDPHAGALVSMHWAGLYRTRWGVQGGEPVGHPATAEVVAEQQQRWVRALNEAWGFRGLRSDFEAGTWHAYEVLQALDFLSLAICLLDLDRPCGDEAALPMPGTLRPVDQPPGPRLVPSVPVAEGGEHVDLRLSVPEPGRVALDPYPFDPPDGFEVEVPVRELEDRRYASEEAAAEALHRAPGQRRRVRIGPSRKYLK